VHPYELRESDDARRFLGQGLWWQRVLRPAAASVRAILEWALEVASSGQPLPPLGFLADLGHVAFGQDGEQRSREPLAVAALPLSLLRTYEDHVLGKLYADWTFARASDALRRYEGRDRARGLAFFVRQLHERNGFPGVELSPGVIKAALEAPPDDLINLGRESLQQEGPEPMLVGLYESLIVAARHTAEVVGPEDIFELEHRTALDPEGERLARRQVLRAAATLRAALPRHRVRPLTRQRDVPTRILDEDTYPVGGFTSLSTRGSVESLLHSQLAFMEKDERPDLFDIKFLRDELLYYARDENQLLRRRRTFAFVLEPDLDRTRFKDADLPYQRGVLLLALMIEVIRKLLEWLSTDALVFRLVFVTSQDRSEGTPARRRSEGSRSITRSVMTTRSASEGYPLQAEYDILAKVFKDEIEYGSVLLEQRTADAVADACGRWAQRSLCHCLVVGTDPPLLTANDTLVARLQVAGPRPALGEDNESLQLVEGEDALESWGKALEQILERFLVGA
jgi:hypothetical protein